MVKVANMLKSWKGDYKFKTCLCEGCPKQFTNDIDMDNKIRKRKEGMAKGMCWKGLGP